MLSFKEISSGILFAMSMVFSLIGPYVVLGLIAAALGYCLFRLVLKQRGDMGAVLFTLLYILFLSPNKD